VVRSVVGLGRGLRRAHAVRVRQPLPSLTVVSHDAAVRAAVDAHAELIAEELNVKQVATSENERAHAHLSAKPNYRRLGPRLGARMKAVAVEIEGLDEAAVAGLLGGGTIDLAGTIEVRSRVEGDIEVTPRDVTVRPEPIGMSVVVPPPTVVVTAEDVVVTRTPRPGVVVAAAERLAVALDTTVTPELAREGLAREVVKTIQALRRAAGLEVADRITLAWASESAAVAEAMAEHGDWIAGEVLALEVARGEPGPGEPVDVDGHAVWLGVARR
jgi:isoleucyl-tRNA synthetase